MTREPMRRGILAAGLLLTVLFAGCTSPSYDDGDSKITRIDVQVDTEYARKCGGGGFYNPGHEYEVGAIARNTFYDGWIRVGREGFQLIGPNQTVWEPDNLESDFPRSIKLHPGDQAKGKITFDTEDVDPPLTLRYSWDNEDTYIDGHTVIHNTTKC